MLPGLVTSNLHHPLANLSLTRLQRRLEGGVTGQERRGPAASTLSSGPLEGFCPGRQVPAPTKKKKKNGSEPQFTQETLWHQALPTSSDQLAPLPGGIGMVLGEEAQESDLAPGWRPSSLLGTCPLWEAFVEWDSPNFPEGKKNFCKSEKHKNNSDTHERKL